MMARHSILRATGVVSIFGAAGPALDEVGLSAWIAQAAPGETLVYHRGFLAVDATSVISKLPAEQQRWDAYRRERLCADNGLSELSFDQFKARIGELRSEHADAPERLALLDSLQAWGDGLRSELG